jgi:hypothetical protein
VFDVTDPAAPVRLGEYVHPDGGSLTVTLHDLYVEDGIAYLNYWDLGMVVVDTTDPANIELLGVFDDYERRTSHSSWVTTAGGRRIAVHGDEDFDAHVRIVDVDPASPEFMTEIGEFSLRPEVSVHNIMAFGETAYISHYQDGIRLLDLSDPTQPAQIAHYRTWDGGPDYGFSPWEGAIGLDVDLGQGLIYVADTRGLVILRRTR